MSIGYRIKSRRLQLNLSQHDLGDMIGTTQKQIWRYEQDKNSPTGDVIIALAKALDTSTDWLLGMTDIVRQLSGEPNLTDLEREAVLVLRTKTPDAQRKAIEVLKVM